MPRSRCRSCGGPRDRPSALPPMQAHDCAKNCAWTGRQRTPFPACSCRKLGVLRETTLLAGHAFAALLSDRTLLFRVHRSESASRFRGLHNIVSTLNRTTQVHQEAMFIIFEQCALPWIAPAAEPDGELKRSNITQVQSSDALRQLWKVRSDGRYASQGFVAGATGGRESDDVTKFARRAGSRISRPPSRPAPAITMYFPEISEGRKAVCRRFLAGMSSGRMAI